MKNIKRIGPIEVVGGMTLNNRIIVNGVRIGRFTGSGRCRDHKGTYFTCGIRLDDGREVDLSGYSYFADVLKNLPHELAQLGVAL